MNNKTREIQGRVVTRVSSPVGRRGITAILAAFCLAVGAAALIPSLRRPVSASNPSGATISEANPQLNWTGGIMPANPDLLNSPRCAGAHASACDNFNLTVAPKTNAKHRF